MIAMLKPYIERKEEDLDFEERNILSVAFKNAVGLRRIALRAAKKTQSVFRYEKYANEVEEYYSHLEEECVDLCKQMLTLIQKYLLPLAKKDQNSEAEVQYLKL
jgi:hypothetical protein